MPISTFLTDADLPVSHPGYVAGQYYATTRDIATDTTSQAVWTPNTITYAPFQLFYDATIIRVAVNCSTAKTSADGRFGWYTNENGRPKTLLFDSTNISFQTAGVKEAVTSLILKKGWYWSAGTSTIAPFLSVATLYMGWNAILGQSSPSVTVANGAIRHTGTSAFTSLPTTAPISNLSFLNGAISPIFWFKTS